MLVNLLENAIDAAAYSLLRQVSAAASAESEHALFPVEDPGPGGSAAQRPRHFEPSRTNKEGGSGMELAIPLRIAESLCERTEVRDKHREYAARIVHIQPGLAGARGDFSDAPRLLEQSYSMACAILDRCHSGGNFVEGHYHETPADRRTAG